MKGGGRQLLVCDVEKFTPRLAQNKNKKISNAYCGSYNYVKIKATSCFQQLQDVLLNFNCGKIIVQMHSAVQYYSASSLMVVDVSDIRFWFV